MKTTDIIKSQTNLPGAPQHQALLQAIVERYAPDERVLAVVVFGSLGRGNWDVYSDLDLDVVLADGVTLDVPGELHALADSLVALGERAAGIIPDEDEEEGDILLESLMMLSIRYHPLATTSPNIVDSLRMLSGCIDAAAIVAAGEANRRPPPMPLERLLDACVRDAAVAHVGVQRGWVWYTVEVLHRLCGRLLEIYARTHGGRALRAFEMQAKPGLQARLEAALPQADPASLRRALFELLDIMEHDLGQFSGGQLSLTPAHQHVLQNIRKD